MPFIDPAAKKAYDIAYAARHREKKRAYDAARYSGVRTKKIASAKTWVENNRPKARINKAKWRAKNPERVKAWARSRQKEHLAEYAAQRALRRARTLRATPAWANLFFIEEAYHLAKLRSEATGIEWHVDHIVPLQSKRVCGLHVENNLRVIPAFNNRSKGNRHWPNMSEEKMAA